MRELGSLIPVVPLLAKADTLLPAELKVSACCSIGSMSITVLQQTMGMRNLLAIIIIIIIIIIVTGLESHTRCASQAHVVRLYVP